MSYQPLLEHIIVTGQQLTGKKITPAPSNYDTYQTRKAIKFSPKYQNVDTGDFIFIMHEICHFLAANHQMRKKYNLSFPVFEQKDSGLKLNHAISELKAIYFTQQLYLPWMQAQTSLPEIWIKYFEYLCNVEDKGSLLAELQTEVIDTSIWDKQLNRKLSHLGYDRDTFQKQLQSYSYTN